MVQSKKKKGNILKKSKNPTKKKTIDIKKKWNRSPHLDNERNGT